MTSNEQRGQRESGTPQLRRPNSGTFPQQLQRIISETASDNQLKFQDWYTEARISNHRMYVFFGITCVRWRSGHCPRFVLSHMKPRSDSHLLETLHWLVRGGDWVEQTDRSEFGHEFSCLMLFLKFAKDPSFSHLDILNYA